MKHNINYTIAATVFLIVTMLPVHAQVTPNDPGFIPHQEYLRVVKADEAWSQTTGNPSQPISIIGLGGVDIFHEDLIARDIDFTSVRDFPERTFINLTPITGIVGAATNNSTGIAGVNWQSPLKVHDIAVEGSFQQGSVLVIQESAVDDLISTATYTDNSRLLYMPFNWSGSSNPIELDTLKIDYPFNIREIVEGFRSFLVNSIFGIARSLIQAPGSDWNNALQASKAAYLNGSVIVGKMADYDGVFTGFPASLGADRISISVGALDKDFFDHYQFSSQPRADRARAGFSDIDVAAPGQNIYSTVVSSDPSPYTELTGTAYAGSIVTGGVSLMQDVNPNLEPDDVKEILRRTSFDVGAPGYDPRTGFGRVDIKKAVDYAKNRTFTRGTAAVTSTTKIDDNRWVTLFNGVWGDLASGTYIVDVYEAKAEIPLPVFGESEVWFRAKNTLGWSAANPNYQSRFATVEMDPSRNVAVLTTYVYKIESNITGQSLNVWRPADLDDAQIAYTIATKPRTSNTENQFVTDATINVNKTYNGNLFIDDGVTVTFNADVTFNGGNVYLGKDARLEIGSSGKIVANGTHFQSFDSGNSNERYEHILVDGNYSSFNLCTFEGGKYNLFVKANHVDIAQSTFKNGYWGLRTAWLVNLNLEGVTIQDNSDHGLHAWSSDIEMRETFIELTSNSQTRIPSIVSNNGGIGIYLAGSSTLYMHGSASKNNGSSEIYIRENARLFAGDQQSDVNQGHNRISESNSVGYYIYSLARTSDGEAYQNWRVPARFNYWGSSSAPSSSRFFGNVDRSDHLDYDPAVMETIFDDTQCTESPCPIRNSAAPQEMLTMNVSKSVAENAGDPHEIRRMVESKQRLMDLRNEIKKEPMDPHNAQRLKEAVYLARYIERSKPGSERRKSEQRIEKWRDRLITMTSSGNNNFYSSSDLTALQDNKNASENGMEKRMREHRAKVFMGETALIMELENAIYDGKYQDAKALIKENRGYINNTDNQASLWLFESILHENNKEFGKALAALQKVEQIEPEADIKENYVAPDFTVQKQLLRDSMRVYNQQVPVPAANRNLVTQEVDNDLPQSFELSPAFPNPFNPATQIPFALPEAAEVRVEVYSITGRLVAVLANGRFDAGRHTVAFNAAGLASGVYLVRARLGEKVQTRKITLVK